MIYIGMKKPVYIIDGYGLIFRSYFAFIRQPLFNDQGKNVSAIFGFFRSILQLIQREHPEYLVVALDSLTPTFRHEQYPEYKATRERAPEDLIEQFPIIEEILDVLGVHSIRANGFEADDIIATLARGCSREARECFIVSSDKDLMQLVDDSVHLYRPDKGGSFIDMDAAAVFESKGVYPTQIVDFLALVGDSSDNVPGVKGIGEKTAASLLAQFGTLKAIYECLDGDNPDAIKSKSQRTKLTEGRDLAWQSRELVILREDIDLGRDMDSLQLGELNKLEAARYFAREGIRSLARDLGGAQTDSITVGGGELGEHLGELRERATSKLKGLDPSGAESQGDLFGEDTSADASHSDTGDVVKDVRPVRGAPTDVFSGEQSQSGDYRSITDPGELEAYLEEALNADVVAVDLETDSINDMQANPVGFSFSFRPGTGVYVALRAAGTEYFNENELRAILKRFLENPDFHIVGQNFKYDYKVLCSWGITPASVVADTMIEAWLVDTGGNSYGMDSLAMQYLGYKPMSYNEAVGHEGRGKSDIAFDSVELERATTYAAEDADITLRLHQVFSPIIRQRGLSELFETLEMPLVPLLARMEMRGIRLDSEQLARYADELRDIIATTEEKIYELCGHEFNIASTRQLQEVLFEERKLSPGKKTKTGYSTDTGVLHVLAKEDPVPALVLKHRQLTKLLSTYVESLPQLVNPRTGRLHTHYNLTGTATGRLSSKDPNLQNIPIRDEEGRRIREAFVPEEGWGFVSADYSQVELVILAHLSGDANLQAAFRDGVDVHRQTAALLFSEDIDKVTSEQRRIAKTINFGVMYGMSAFRLSNELDIPRRDAKEFIDAYFARYQGIKRFVDATVTRAEAEGGVRTILGRERPLPGIRNRNRTVKQAAERVAVNTPIQGSAADIMKRAMIAIETRLQQESLQARMLLQVHDEIIVEAPQEELDRVERLMQEEMSGAMKLDVPLRVSVERGQSWGDMH